MIGRCFKKAAVGVFVISAVTLIIGISGICGSADAAPIRLIFASWEGPQGTMMAAPHAWAQELEKRSGGRVKVEFAYAEAMGKAPEHYDLAARGVASIAFVSVAFTPGRFPMAEVNQLPISGEPSGEVLSKATWELLKKGYFDKDFQDVKVLWLCSERHYSYHMGKAKVQNFDDMKGKKIRAAGAMHIEIVKALGSVPVGMAAPEVYGALDKGTIDGAMIPYSFVATFRSETVTKSIVEEGITANTFVYVMNKPTYERLPADIRAIIDEISPKYAEIAGKRVDEYTEKGRALLKSAGVVSVRFSDKDKQRLDDAMAPVWQKWIAAGEAKRLPRKKMVNDFYNILRGMGVQKPFLGYAP